jgi:uncharacterized membrane protein
MVRRSGSQSAPSWVKPGARWVAWVTGPMLFISIVLLVLRVASGDSAMSIAWTSCQVVLFILLLASNRSARRKHQTPRPVPSPSPLAVPYAPGRATCFPSSNEGIRHP